MELYASYVYMSMVSRSGVACISCSHGWGARAAVTSVRDVRGAYEYGSIVLEGEYVLVKVKGIWRREDMNNDTGESGRASLG